MAFHWRRSGNAAACPCIWLPGKCSHLLEGLPWHMGNMHVSGLHVSPACTPEAPALDCPAALPVSRIGQKSDCSALQNFHQAGLCQAHQHAEAAVRLDLSVVLLLPGMVNKQLHQPLYAFLQEGEQQGRLNEGSFKAMNLGLAGAGAGHLAVLVPVFLSGTGGYALPALLGLWGFTTVNAGASLLRK